MKRLLVANKQKTGKSRYFHERMDNMLKAQIDNLLELGWVREDIILLTNFNFEFMNIKAEVIELNDFCLSGSKMWGLKHLFDNDRVHDIIFSSDLDCWQNVKFECPVFSGDVGACEYSKPKFNGGAIFWKPEAKDIVDEVVRVLTERHPKSEEPTLNALFKSDKYKNRVSVLDHTYNVGCSGFFERFTRSTKPIRVCHFQPENRVAWEIHGLDRDGVNEIVVTVRLERLLRKYYPDLATELKDKNVPNEKRAKREAKMKKKEKKV